LLLGLVLGGLAESEFRRALITSGGDFMIFVERPICLVLLTVALAAFVLPIFLEIYRHVKSKNGNQAAKAA
jgi:putative tricarboxylic transport membrane protein